VRRNSRNSWLCISLAVLCAAPCILWLSSAEAEPAAETTKREDVDCRFSYPNGAADPDVGKAPVWENTTLPDGDVFRPLMADPKQPQIFGIMQSTKALDSKTTSTIGSISFGENFGLWTRRKQGTCDGIQVGLLTGVFSQFNLFDNTELVNTDFVIGIPFSWRTDFFSGRVRLYHQSSHLGDEFLLARPGFTRVDYRFEELEGILSLNTPNGWGRVYFGGGYLVHRQPSNLDRLRAQWGIELRGPEYPAPWSSSSALKMVPVLAADFKAFEELQWVVNTNLLAGVEWFRAGATRRLRVLLNYYYGYNPYGQFFSQKVETVGLGLYLAF
jgi:Protein of unknown function (DUF1207)